MVYTLSDLKHLETIASLQDNEIEPAKPLLSQAKEDSSLTMVLLKLCNKLRVEGFNKYADSIENKFVSYKAAGVHLYKVHKETGEDLIDTAHPEGDNKIVSDVSDNNGDVETITSRHKKIVDIVQKQPTGKLASYINQCKIALAQTYVDDLYGQAATILNSYSRYFSIISDKVNNPQMKDNGEKLVSKLQSMLKSKSPYEESKNENKGSNIEDELTTQILYYKGQEEPGFFSSFEMGSVDKTTWTNEVLPLFTKAEELAKSFHDLMLQILKVQSQDKTTSVLQDAATEKSTGPSDEVSIGLKAVRDEMEQLEARVNEGKSEDKPAQLQWLAGMKKFVGDKLATYSFSEDKASLYKQYSDILNQVKERLNSFKSEIG